MRAIGIDIGTSTICALVINISNGDIVETITKQNTSALKSNNSWESIQDPAIIMNIVEELVLELTEKYSPISCIGFTGQMHGIVYIDEAGNVVSPLYTWQDGRGEINYKDGLNYSEYLSKGTGYKLSTGFGAVTHFYNSINELVPTNAKKFCTIHDYAAMKLTGKATPLLHVSNAASIGFFNIEANCFDRSAIKAVGMNPAFFPQVSQKNMILGYTSTKIPIALAIGDNQASFLGSVKSSKDCISINIGTSSQISFFTNCYSSLSQVETRPFVDGAYIFVGSPLCGGRAYALLESFFRSVVQLGTTSVVQSFYEYMNELANDYLSINNPLEICTKFSGTRNTPTVRGSIKNLGTDNFTPAHFVVGILEGIATELYELYVAIPPQLNLKPKMLICSGNGVRLNNPLQRIISSKFNMPIQIPLYKEEAAFGSIIFALVSIGYFKSFDEAQNLIKLYICYKNNTNLLFN